jgi:hypothetical protein
LTSGATSRQVIDMSDTIDILEPDKMPFIVFLKRGLGKRTGHNWKVEWFTDTPFPYLDTLDGSHAAGDTTITVDNPTYWQVWDTGVEMANHDVFRVASIDGSVLTVAWITTPTSGMADATQLMNTGSAYESGADYKDPKSTKETADYNYLQIFRDTVGATEVQRMTKMYGGGDWAYQVRKKANEHGRKLERAALFNERDYTTSGTHPYGVMRGMNKWISTHRNASFGSVSQKKLDDEFRAVREEDMSNATKYIVMCSLATKATI